MIAGLMILAGCDRPSTVVSLPGPMFDPIAFFQGHTRSIGVIEDRSGAPSDLIETDSLATIDAEHRLHMVQTLRFGGKTRERTWTLWRTGDTAFDATANDMIGVAHGESAGGSFHWEWELARSPGNPLMNVTMEQWMYAMPDGAVLIRTTIRKLGFIVAEVTEQFRHLPGRQVADAG